MNDEYANFPTKIFIDANVVLEALPLSDLPWSEIDPVGPILIMVTPTLLSEVDSKKRDSRLGVRAREFNRFIATTIKDGQPIIKLAEGPPHVDIGIAKCNRFDWADYDDLDRLQGDARFIVDVLNVKGVPKEQRIVVGQDINPLFMAQRYGLKIYHIPDSWLPRLGPSPDEKVIKELKKKIGEYAEVEPQFIVKLKIQSGPLELQRVQKLTKSEMSTLAANIIAANPKPKQERDPNGWFSTTQYDRSLDDRYSKYECKQIPTFVSDFHKKIELLFGQVPYTLSVENTGQVRADHINIDVQIVGGWFNTKPIVSALYPSAPRIKNQFLHSPLRFPSPIRRPVGRHVVEVDAPHRSEKFSAQCEDFRHGQREEFSGVVWLDPHQERKVVIIVKVTAANFHGENRTLFKLDKSISCSHAFELVDRNNGRALKAYHIKPLVDEAIRNSKIGTIEWDHLSDND